MQQAAASPRSVIVGLGRLDGRPVGIVANQPTHLGGVLFVDSSDKVARFVWLCDAFNIPLVFLADVPGFMIGSAVERQGIIRHGAKLITAVSVNSTPPLTIGLLATKPTGDPSINPKPTTSSGANSGFTSKKLSASTRHSITRCMS